MPLAAGDIAYFQSELEGSSGGAISTLRIPLDQLCLVFPDATRGQLKYGGVDYRKFFVVNAHPTDTLFSARLWLLMQPTGGSQAAVGRGDATDTDGESVEYSSPSSRENALYLGDLAPGSATAFWARRVVPALTPPFDRGFFQMAVAGLSLQEP